MNEFDIVTKGDVFRIMKVHYPLLATKQLSDVVESIPVRKENQKMTNRYITAKEFRKMSIVVELLTMRYNRNSIHLHATDTGWNMVINDRDASIVIDFTDDEIKKKDTMDLLDKVIGFI